MSNLDVNVERVDNGYVVSYYKETNVRRIFATWPSVVEYLTDLMGSI